MRAAKVQASLRIRAVSPEPPLLAHTSSGSRGIFRQKARSLAPLNGWACAVKICHDGMLEDTNSLDGAHINFKHYFFSLTCSQCLYGMLQFITKERDSHFVATQWYMHDLSFTHLSRFFFFFFFFFCVCVLIFRWQNSCRFYQHSLNLRLTEISSSVLLPRYHAFMHLCAMIIAM